LDQAPPGQCISIPAACFSRTKPFSWTNENVLKQNSGHPVSNKQGMAEMQFIFDFIWMQSCENYLEAMGKQETQQ